MGYQFRDVCWKQAYNRGIGRAANKCEDHGWEFKAGLCYLKCDDYRSCCVRGQGVLSRGNFQDGEFSNTCRSDGATYCYQQCAPGMKQIGLSCRGDAKDNYTRWSCTRAGTRRLPVCPSERERHQGLCYKPCPTNSKPIGPLCWHNCEGTEYPASMGALCCKDEAICAEATVEIVKLIAGQLKKCFVDHFMNIPACLKDMLEIQRQLRQIPRCTMEFEWPDSMAEYIEKNVWKGETQEGYDFILFDPSNKRYVYYDVDNDNYGIMKIPDSVDMGQLSSMYKFDGQKRTGNITKISDT